MDVSNTHDQEDAKSYMVREVSVHDDNKIARTKVEAVDVRSPRTTI